jgi:hypothetical protein
MNGTNLTCLFARKLWIESHAENICTFAHALAHARAAGLASACRAARSHLLGALCTLRKSETSQQDLALNETSPTSSGTAAGARFAAVDTQGVAADRLVDLEAMCDAHETELLRGQLQAATNLRNYLNAYV